MPGHKLFLTAAAVFVAVSLSFAADTERSVSFGNKLAMERDVSLLLSSPSRSLPDTIRLLALMVEFQPDDDPLTTGNGLFDLSTSAGQIIDPPPRNRAYFENHLRFLHNYWRKASNGTIIVVGEVVDTIIQLSHPMRHYSPPSGSTTNIELGRLVEDSWRALDVARQSLDFFQYHSFCIFHAGVGRDIDMVSLIGYDPTPFDIPSLFVSLASMQSMFGSDYRGVAVRDSTFFITNTMILPETESRTIQTITGPFLLQLGLNGLLAASFGSYLGLPDLFDTRTGRSGIGRFGLMDGNSIFSWNGVFPPEPSAWEKYFLDSRYNLGMLEVRTVPPEEAVYELPAVTLSDAGTDTIYRVSISAKEYFLVENRNRDARRDSVKVWMVFEGDTIRKAFWRDTVRFNAFDQRSLYGVIIDVDEFDWSLPGGVTTTNEFLDGGILIWHIDETVIDAHYATNTVNANPARRGVGLKEADGSQDIGQVYDFLHPGGASSAGWPLDFWFSRNPAPIYRNEFSPTTFPNSRSHTGANSHVTIREFSASGPRMTARIKIGDDHIRPLSGFPKNVGQKFGPNSITMVDLTGDGVEEILVATSGEFLPVFGAPTLPPWGSVYGWKNDGTPAFAGGDTTGRLVGGILPATVFRNTIAAHDMNGDGVMDFTIGALHNTIIVPPPPGFTSNGLYAWTMTDSLPPVGFADTLFQRSVARRVTTSPVIGQFGIAFGSEGGVLYRLSPNDFAVESIRVSAVDSSNVVGVSVWDSSVFVSLTEGGTISLINPLGIVKERSFSKTASAAAVVGHITPTLLKRIAFATTDGFVYLLDGDLQVSAGFPVATGGEVRASPALADINGDGQREIIVFSGDKIFAINAAGAILDFFPIRSPSAATLASSPIVADITGDGEPNIIAVTSEGVVLAYDRRGRMVRGFPLLAGLNSGSTPAVFFIPTPALGSTDVALAVAADDGHVYAWRTGAVAFGPGGAPPIQPWRMFMRDARNTGLEESPLVISPLTDQFFPASRVYNWPNPVYGGKTSIRYYVSDDARINAKIFDLAGSLVDELTAVGIGGLDNEIEWNVGNIQSGVYLARIEAEGGGKRGVAVIKVAIVR